MIFSDMYKGTIVRPADKMAGISVIPKDFEKLENTKYIGGFLSAFDNWLNRKSKGLFKEYDRWLTNLFGTGAPPTSAPKPTAPYSSDGDCLSNYSDTLKYRILKDSAEDQGLYVKEISPVQMLQMYGPVTDEQRLRNRDYCSSGSYKGMKDGNIIYITTEAIGPLVLAHELAHQKTSDEKEAQIIAAKTLKDLDRELSYYHKFRN
ncbi:MAG: hypothetical protein HZB65_00410 [Candidatus Aenigmarchaeota archaeon]|nr:hypothetical protein [Candidatus Aenigmarchaeota archaeon]